MVNATVDNKPVSIILDGGQSTTVPSNETWRVSIHLSNGDDTRMSIDGIGSFISRREDTSSDHSYLDVTLTGGQTVSETQGTGESAMLITGFVVSS